MHTSHTSDFNKYFSLNPSNEVINICEPLFKSTNINYFLYSRLYSDGTKTFLSTRNDLLKWIYSEKNTMSSSASNITPGIYLAKDFVGSVPSADSKRVEIQMKGARNYFNIDLIENGIYFINRENSDYCELFEFAASPSTPSLIGFYLNHIDFLNYFTLSFKDKGQNLIKQANKIRLKPQNVAALNSAKEDKKNHTFDDSEFFQATKLNSLTIDEDHIQTRLTRRELECLAYLISGHTLKEIAKLLTLSPKTVESYLENTKLKLHCDSKSSLIQKAIELHLFNPTYLNWLLSQPHS